MTKWVALVDDDMANLRIAGKIMSDNKIHVSAMKSGAALLRFVKDNRPDLILLDISMPEMDGFETLTRLRELEREEDLPEIPVIFLTADETIDTESRGFEMGVSDFIRKPFNPEVLLKRIDNVVNKQASINAFKKEATIDKLTGFLNKSATDEKLTEMCKSNEGCFMIIDLDSFKLVNDIYGHEMGDKVIIAFSEQIKLCTEHKSVFGRIGGDEFAAFSEGLLDEKELGIFTSELNAGLMMAAKELMGEDMDIPLGASVGAVFVPGQGTEYTELYKLADKALYTVKQNGKHGYGIYSRENETSDGVSYSNVRNLATILKERNIKNCAMWLEKAEFMYVYRFLLRYIKNYRISACEVLLTLSEPDDMDDEEFSSQCEGFGESLNHSLRKSDIMMRLKKNQYFFLLIEVDEGQVDNVLTRIVNTWNDTIEGKKSVISYDIEMILPDDRTDDDRRRKGLEI